VKTAFVCEVAFAEWTLDGELRQTTFLGWRTIRIQRKWYWSKPEKAEIRKWRSRKPSSREKLQNLFPASALVCRGSLSERDCSKRRTLCVGYSQFFYVSLRILDPDVFLCTPSQWVAIPEAIRSIRFFVVAGEVELRKSVRKKTRLDQGCTNS
jgi:hypothetical protein